MLRLSLTLLGAALLAPTLAAQSLLRATLDGTQEVPAVVTDAGGWCNITLDTTTGVATYDLRTFGLSGTAAHFHDAAGGIEVVLMGGPVNWSGSSLPLSAGQMADMQAGDWYVNVHTAANPNGEIRGNFPAADTFRNSLVAALNAATLTRATVLRKVAEAAELQTREFNTAFVAMEYFGYLRRDPDTAGFNFWLNKLNAFNGDFVASEMVKAFITSSEYRQRFGP